MFSIRDGIREVINTVGPQARLARLLNVSPTRVNKWLNGEEDVPFDKAVEMELLTGGAVIVDQLTLKKPAARKALRILINRGRQDVMSVMIRTLIQHNPDITWLSQHRSFYSVEKHDYQIRPIVIDQQYVVISGIHRIQEAIHLKIREMPARILNLRLLLRGESIIHNVQDLLISEKVAIGIALERSIGGRQGQRKKSQLPQISAEVRIKKETRAIVAKIIGFGCHFTYIQAKTVTSKGSQNLIAAMDNELISISRAAQLALLSVEEHESFLQTIYEKRRQASCH